MEEEKDDLYTPKHPNGDRFDGSRPGASNDRTMMV